jgi:uncharacterized protein (DUF983 family)
MTTRHRHAESPLQFPTATEALRGLSRAARLRCPHCGSGHVLTRFGAVRARCAGCNLRFERTDDSYFSGAMTFGFLLGGFTFGITFLLILVTTWPDPPWDALQYAPIAMAFLMALVIPASRVLWLTVDVLMRPVIPEELQD